MDLRIADDEQWRFPPIQKIPHKLAVCVTSFEDRYFEYHPGINPWSLLRAAYLNIKHQKVVSGGSTISMQVIRLSRNNPSRSLWEKFWEVFRALRMELSYSKEEILQMYLSHAPYGGNIVGVEAAAYFYCGRPVEHLSWGEAAFLAVLPNAPSLVFPGKNQKRLKEKRDKLLTVLLSNHEIDSTTYQLAISEPLPKGRKKITHSLPHLLLRVEKEHKQEKVVVTIDRNIQRQVEQIILNAHRNLKNKGIKNAACLVLDVQTGNTLAYVGNVNSPADGNQVDMITSLRSPGSTLKPFLYAQMLHEGELLPYQFVLDIPTYFGTYVPQNYRKTYLGAVPAADVISFSLNIPATRMLSIFGSERLLAFLRQAGIYSLKKTSDHYGLSLVLGGGEISMWELCGALATMARILHRYGKGGIQRYTRDDIFPPSYTYRKPNPHPTMTLEAPLIRASAIWYMFKAMKEVKRPETEVGYQHFALSEEISWKTGTSFGFRDAWAVGTNGRYVVGVWTGNADGEGKEELIGIQTSAPMLFQVFRGLLQQKAFEVPYEDLRDQAVCGQSGYKASPNCTERDTLLVPASAIETLTCPYHILIHLDPTGKYQVTTQCEEYSNIQTVSRFVLPPTAEFYYTKYNSNYQKLPPFKGGCAPPMQQSPITLIYPPKNKMTLFIPINLAGEKEKVIFEAVHRQRSQTLYWHLDNKFIGSTQNIHQLALFIEAGTHVLSVYDADGNYSKRVFVVVDNRK